MVEHLAFNQMVIGSNPVTFIMKPLVKVWQLKSTNMALRLSIKRQKLVQFVRLAQLMKSFATIQSTDMFVFYPILARLFINKRGWSFTTDTTRPRDGKVSRITQYQRIVPARRSQVTSLVKRDIHPDWPLFTQYWYSMGSKAAEEFVPHPEYRLLFMAPVSYNRFIRVLSARNHFKRWFESYNFLLNIFTVDTQLQMLPTQLFMEESLTFNWQFNKITFRLFRYAQPILYLADTRYGDLVRHKCTVLKELQVDAIIVLDIKAQEKTVRYLKENSFYLFGLVPVNYSPWLLSYPFPSMADSQAAQYYFIKYLFYLRSKALETRRKRLFNLWQSSKPTL